MHNNLEARIHSLHYDKFFIIIDRLGVPVKTSHSQEEMIAFCNTEEGLKARYRMLETQVTKIHIFGAFSGEKVF